MSDDYKSPLVMQIAKVHLDGDSEKDSLYLMAEVRRADDNRLLATCMMSDDAGLETIADRLSAMQLPREANRFRMMIDNSRRGKL